MVSTTGLVVTGDVVTGDVVTGDLATGGVVDDGTVPGPPVSAGPQPTTTSATTTQQPASRQRYAIDIVACVAPAGECSPSNRAPPVRTVRVMPTSSEYHVLAVRFEGQAHQVTSLGSALVTLLQPGLVVGPVDRVIQLAAQAHAANISACARELRAVAATCRARARVCSDYTAALQRYRAALAAPATSTIPTPPSRPAPWAEAG